MLNEYIKERIQALKLSPLVGESVNRQVDERGKREEKRKNDSDLCTPTCPYRLAWLGTSLRVQGKLTLRKKEIIVLYLYTLLTVSYAGFFAKSQIMFSLLSSFQFCSPLKNDGRGVLFCHNVLMLNEYIKERTQALKLFPLVGESVNRQVDERGKCEQKGKNSFL